jgi:hypothetical protein
MRVELYTITRFRLRVFVYSTGSKLKMLYPSLYYYYFIIIAAERSEAAHYS